MTKKKIAIILALMLLISVFLTGCSVYEWFADMFCCGGFLPLPIAAVLIKLFAS